jgi:hypothetical protein
MKTEVQLNQEILETTTMIRNQYPELIKYLNETQLNTAINNRSEINIKVLANYAQSLKNIIIKHGVSHD